MSTVGLWNLAAETPGTTAVVEAETGRSVTRAELAARTNQIVHALRARGLRTGSVVAAVMENEIPLLEVFFAALQAGWYFVPINYHLTQSEIEHILSDSDAEAVVCSPAYTAVVAAAADVAGIPAAMRIVSGPSTDALPEGFVRLDDVLAGAPTERPGDLTSGWMMTYTSGTTGRPKGIKRALNGIHPDAVGEVWTLPMRIFGITGEAHVHLAQSPFYHTAVLTYVNASVHYGHTVVLMRSWTPEGALAAIERHRVTTTHMVPTQFHRMLQLPDDVRAKYDLSSMRYAVHGAAPCPIETKKKMIEWFGPVVYEYYGASEGGGTTVNSTEWLERPGTVGRPWPGGQVSVRDEDGNEVPPGVHGTVWMLMGALEFDYHKSPEKSAASKHDGFFTVGDVGHVDDAGYLFLHGRQSDIIITGGVNVHPSEVEAVLHNHPAVADVAVFDVPDPEWGEAIKAVVQLRAGVDPSEALVQELRDHCRSHLASYKVPRTVDFTDELPRDPNGKLYKRLLRAPYWEQTGQ